MTAFLPSIAGALLQLISSDRRDRFEETVPEIILEVSLQAWTPTFLSDSEHRARQILVPYFSRSDGKWKKAFGPAAIVTLSKYRMNQDQQLRMAEIAFFFSRALGVPSSAEEEGGRRVLDYLLTRSTLPSVRAKAAELLVRLPYPKNRALFPSETKSKDLYSTILDGEQDPSVRKHLETLVRMWDPDYFKFGKPGWSRLGRECLSILRTFLSP